MFVSLSKAILLGSLPLLLAAPTQKRDLTQQVLVTVEAAIGSVVGVTTNGIDSFRGIPYAQPPVGNLRLRKPQPLTASSGTIQATEAARACPQMKSTTNTGNLADDTQTMITNTPFGQEISNTGEDCLTVSIQRPSSFTGTLPVVFWIYGGGFQTGSTQVYDATNILTASIAQGKPFIWVAVNYRLSGFGFLPGKQVRSEGIANLGLLDQRMGMQWVADNIAAFGGDPNRVTIWGESAGSISTFSHMTLYNGNNLYKGKPLFKAAIMNSGSIVPADPVDCPKGEAVFQQVVKQAGCAAVAASQVLDCLRSLDYSTYLNAVNSLPTVLSYSALALPYMPRPDGTALTDSPEVLIKQGKYTKIPMIIGDQEDEGTLFSLAQTNLTTTAALVDYLASLYFPQYPASRVAALVALYPDDPAAGSPFRTGALNNIYSEYKRLSAILGDLAFTLRRRQFLALAQAAAPTVPTWSYLSTYDYGVPLLGTFHATDILQIYGATALNSPSAVTVAPSPGIVGFAQASIYHYYINFFSAGDPNAGAAASLGYQAGLFPQWPQWGWGRNLLNFGILGNSILSDDFRAAAYDFYASPSQVLRV